MRLSFVGWYVLFIGLACACAKSPPHRIPSPPAVIEIRGGPKFVHRTQQALKRLEQDQKALTQVKQYIHIIEQGHHSAMWAFERPPRVEITNRTASQSITWYAGVLAHESQHVKYYYVGGLVWNSQQAERNCIQWQLDVMQHIGAPLSEIRYLRSLDGTHCDLDGDGDCDWDDYHSRKW